MTGATDVGVLVVDAGGGVGWWSPRVPAVAGVTVHVGPGVTVMVDIARPAVVMAWAVAPGASPDPLSDAVADPTLSALIDELRARGESVGTFEGRGLSDAWAHRALVAAVARWTLYPVDGAALILDTAVAESRVGNVAAARQLFRVAEYSLIDLASDPWRELSSVASSLILAALTAAQAVEAIPAADALISALEERSTVSDDALLSVLAAWRDSGSERFAGVIDLGGEGSDVEYGVIDPAVVPPRILAWNGAGSGELIIEQTDDGFAVSAALAPGVDPLCKEVGELLAYLAAKKTGELVAVSVASVVGETVVARFAAPEFELGEVVAGFFSAEIDPGDLRRDRFGRGLVTVDRFMLDAWNNDRQAVAALHVVGPESDDSALSRATADHGARLLAAQTASASASSALANLLATQSPGTPAADLIAKRLDAVAAYGAELAEPSRRYLDPLLAEVMSPGEDG